MREVLLVLSVVLSVNLSAQTTDWVKSFGGSKSDKGMKNHRYSAPATPTAAMDAVLITTTADQP